MNILLDAIPLKGLLTGISRYLRNLYTALERLPGIHVTYTDSKSWTPWMPSQAVPGQWMNATSRIWKLPDPIAFGFRVATWSAYEMRIRRRIRRHHYDIYHETAFVPAAINRIPQVLTLHDLSLMKCKEMHPKERVWFMDLFFKRRLKYTAHIITVSEFIRREVCDELHVAPDLVTAIHEAPDPIFSPREKKVVQRVVEALGLPQEYILFVGTLEPRKNLSLLMKAAAVCEHPLPIVLVGWKGWDTERLLAALDHPALRHRVFTTGYVDEESLACLYANALALVFPSLYEGFGLPVLEAMACGCPVICSNAASLPEVAGNAARLIDPHDVEELTAAIDSVAEDSGLRNDLIKKGFQRSAHFSWEKTATETLAVFKSVA
ncbi:MAG: glycosyltransferase family 1 protein [Deltaproteobacteria bacterium]|nr:glycosyltransferase family 1 protein [Deltaproteobacteria bacterium]